MVALLARYASRFSVRALDLTVDSSMLWVGAGLALVAAALLAFVPRLPSGDGSRGISLSNGSARVTGGANGRLRAFAITQIAASFVLLAGAAMLLKTLLALQAVDTGIDTRRVLSINVPVISYGRTRRPGGWISIREAMRQGPRSCPAWMASRWACSRPGAKAGSSVPACNSRPKVTPADCGRGSARPIPHHFSRILRRARGAPDCGA